MKTVLIKAAVAALTAGTVAVPVLAQSNPADDTSGYSYNTGKQSYEARMAEDHEWYDNEDSSVTAGYSYNTGSAAAQARNNAFADMPAGDDVTKEEIEAWFAEKGIGAGAAWTDGSYDESGKGGYGYAKGEAAAQERQAAAAEEEN